MPKNAVWIGVRKKVVSCSEDEKGVQGDLEPIRIKSKDFPEASVV